MRAPRTWTELRGGLPVTGLGWARLAATALVLALLAREMAHVIAPLVEHPHGYGRHVWDQTEANRYFVVKALRRFHELPFWNPYACGGFPAWGGIENDTNLVSPFLPAYLALDLPVAIRVEIITWLVFSAIGTWMLAGRFTPSPALRGIAVAVFAVSGRLTLQLGAGHMWNLCYALLPWSLFFLDRAAIATTVRLRDPVALGALLASGVYAGGIYPLPQTIVVLGVYAAWLSISARSPRPLAALAASGLVAVGLSAPKLLPMLDVMHRYPRVLDSNESMTLEQMAAVLLDPDQGFKSSHAGIPWPSWHEHGMYVGVAALGVLAIGAIFAVGRAGALRAIGLVFVVFALGTFSPYAPWALAHRLPILSSQHVPSRWLYPAALLLSCAGASVFERWLARSGRWRAAAEVGLVLLVAKVSFDIAEVARQPLDTVLQEPGSTVEEKTDGFVTEVKLPPALEYQPGEWAPTSLAAERANIGTIECNMFHGLNNFPGAGVALPGYEGRATELGALGRTDPGYRGEAYVLEKRGSATIRAWSPDRVEVEVTGAQPGDHVVLNQNWDPGWHVDGAEATAVAHTIAGTLRDGAGRVVFRYRPPWLGAGVALFLVSCGTLVALGRARLRAARHAKSVG